MSIRTIACSSSNRNSASARASSVLPTPVGPRNMKLPSGRFGSCRPARARRMAFDTATIASSWPMTRLCSRSSMWISFWISPSISRLTGMCVHLLTTSAMSSSSTSSLSMRVTCLQLRQPRFLLADLLLELRDASVLQLGRLGVVARALRAFDVAADLLELFLQLAVPLDRRPSPAATAPRSRRCSSLRSASSFSSLPSRSCDALSFSLRSALALDLELHDAPLDFVELRRHRVDLHAQLRRRLVDQVDRLVRQEAVGDVAVRQHRRGDQRRVLELHLVMNLVALAQAAQDADRVLDRRLADEHRSGSAVRARRPSRCASGTRRASSRRSCAARRARASASACSTRPSTPSAAPAPTTVCSSSMKRMTCPSASAISLSTALSRSSNSPRYFAPATSAPMSSATIRLFFSPSGTSPRDDAPRQPFDDRRLADARLADEHRVVLRAARQHLDDAADLLVAADHRIELALARELGQVAAVALERLVGAFRVLGGDALRSAHAGERLEDPVARHALLLQQLRGGGAAAFRRQCRRTDARC